jgi:hypothetical protein
MTTTTATTTSEWVGENPLPALRDALQGIAELAQSCHGTTAFYRGVLEHAQQHFSAMYAALQVSHAAESSNEQLTAGDGSPQIWEGMVNASLLDSETSGTALARLYDVAVTDRRVAVLSVPIRDSRGNTGALAMVVQCASRESARTCLWELRALMLLACSLSATIRSAHDCTTTGPDAVQRALAKAARFESLTELAFAMANGLKTKFQCEQVVLGKVVANRVQIVCMSSLDTLYPRSPGSRLIRQAMEECLDAGRRFCSKPRGEWSGTGHGHDGRLHRQWRAALGDAAVASIPLFSGPDCVAVLSLVRPGKVGFRGDELEEIEQLAGAYGPAIHLVDRACRSWLACTRDAARAGVAWLLAPRHRGRQVLSVAVAALVIWFCFGTVQYRISVPCQVVPTKVQHFAAPFEGSVASAHVEAGDEVQAGQLLFAMDTRELELQQRELESEAAVCALEITQLVAAQQIDAAALVQARLGVIRARLAGIVQRLALAEVHAPADGMILSGNVKNHVGDVIPVGRSLLEFTPRSQWGAELRVDGRQGGLVSVGQHGRFVTMAQPDQPVSYRLDRVEPAAQVVEGKQVFVAHAQFEGHAPWTLAGMDGVATLEIGPRRVWWVALHRLIDFARLHFWI